MGCRRFHTWRGSLAGSCLAAGLLDEVIVSVIPQLLGAGIPSLAGRERRLQLLEQHGYNSGIVRMRYQRSPRTTRNTDNLLSISAACLFDDQGNLLLVRKRGTQAFMLLGGKRELGETPAALQRELLRNCARRWAPSTFEHLGSFRAPAANEANTRVDADIYVARLPHAVCAQAELEELAWLVPGQAQPDIRAAAARSCPAGPAAARGGKPGNPGRTPDAPRSCALSASATVNEKGHLGVAFSRSRT